MPHPIFSSVSTMSELVKATEGTSSKDTQIYRDSIPHIETELRLIHQSLRRAERDLDSNTDKATRKAIADAIDRLSDVLIGG